MIYYLPSCKYKAAHRDSSQKIQRYLAGKPELRRCGLTWVRLRFTTETGPVCGRVLDQYLRGEDSPPEHFTRGLFYRGVE